ncbi:MAG: hypothetical protein ACI9OO_001952, partial [Bacteroidia bacterium]
RIHFPVCNVFLIMTGCNGAHSNYISSEMFLEISPAMEKGQAL